MQESLRPRAQKAFTLIELLIVVAIIAILAAIAVPNFLEAQVRSKVSRCKADMRTATTAIESYWVDTNSGPTDTGNGSVANLYRPYAGGHVYTADPKANFTVGYELTTPIAYLTSASALKDVFKVGRSDIALSPGLSGRDLYNFANWQIRMKAAGSNLTSLVNLTGNWVMWGAGPDRYTNNPDLSGAGDFTPAPGNTSIPLRISYDPTNGTVSLGDIYRTQKFGDGMGSSERP